MMTSDTNGRPDTSHAGPLAGHPLAFFFLIAYAAAWLLWAPVVLSETGAGLVATQQGAAAGGSQAPVVNRRVRASMLAMPHLRAVDR